VERLPVDRRPEALRHESVDLAGRRVTLERQLREDQLAVERHLEAPTGSRHDRYLRDGRRPAVEKLNRQTGGSIRVASGDAVLDLEDVAHVGRLGGHRDRVSGVRPGVDAKR
jgi:hypothetical protein